MKGSANFVLLMAMLLNLELGVILKFVALGRPSNKTLVPNSYVV